MSDSALEVLVDRIAVRRKQPVQTEGQDEYGTNQTLIPPPPQQDEELHLLPQTTMDESLWASLREQHPRCVLSREIAPAGIDLASG